MYRHRPHPHPGPHGPHCRHFHKFDRVHPRLQRRIFLWFGASIVFTAIVVAILFRVLSPTDRWHRQAEGLERFVRARVIEVWDDPAARDRFVHDLHADMGLDATLFDAHGRVLSQHGGRCEEAWGSVAITRHGERLGRLEVCGDPPSYGGWRFVVILLVAICILWAASGIFARRLLRPLRRLEQTARAIGEGDLSARAGLSPQRHGELGVLGVTLDDMAARIEKQLADQRELLAAVSHELRTPLGHLRVLLEMARDKPDAARVDEIESEVMEVDALVGQLLASSRVEFGTLERRAIDVVELAERALDRVSLATDKLAVIGDARPFEADPTLLARALANVLSNAQSHGGGVTALEVRFAPDRVIFAVEDAGPGFGTSEREKVFEPFYRGEHRAGASLGLGLSLVRRIAQAHGGEAWIEDREERGARVLFSISTHPDAALAV
jgi:two-component system OmpR family sensor kinase